MRKRYKKLLACLTMMLSMSMTLSPIMSFAETADNPNGEDKNNISVEQNDKKAETKTEAKTETKSEDKATDKESKNKAEAPKKDVTKGSKLTLKSGEYGYLAIVNKDKNGKANIITSGENDTVKANVGDTLEIAVYGKNPKVSLKGAETVEKTKLPENASLYKIKVTEEVAEMSVRFDSNGAKVVQMLRMARSAVTSGTITSVTGHGYGEVLQVVLSVSDGDMFGVCCERPNTNTPNKGNVMSLTKVDNNSALGRVAYYGYLNRGNQDSLYATSAAATCIRGANQGTKYGPLSQRIEREARAGTLPAGPSSFECYVGTAGSKQAILFWRDKPQGKVKLLKSVADNKALTEECKKMYSLAGAEYTVYEDAALTRTQGKLITKEDGSTNELEENPGIYYVKETKAPKGFALDPVVHEVEIKAGETATVESKDSPLFDPISIVLKKVADGNSYINPDADMSDAEFTISYYDEMTDDVTGKTPTRVWKLKTIKDKKGTFGAMLRNKYILEGSDELFRDENGIIVIPRGVISIQETKAPKGFKVDPTVHLYKIDTDTEDLSVQLNFGNTPEQPNKPLVPRIKTTAMSENTKNNVGEYGKKIKIIDKVSYKELSEGEKYTVKGKLMDKETGKALKDKDGKEITAEKTFTVTKDNSTITGDGASGTVELTYEVDSTLLKGKTTVIFEKLFYNDKEVATHEDINDEGQSVHFPGIKTTAKSKETNTKQGMPRENETIIDTVKYDNLIPGKEYTVKGKLMDKDTKKPLKDKDGKEITAEKTFTPDKAKGTVDIEFTYNSLLLQGKTTVVFEDMYHNNIKIAVHADINDKDQSIEYPDIKTSADVKETGKLKDNKFTIIDKVTYTNLAVGKEYTVKGKLMDKKTGNPFLVDGKEVTAEKTFTAKTINGSLTIEFVLPSKALENLSVVVFEDMYNDGIKIATHSDLKDKNQTVSVGELTVYPPGENGHPLTGDKTSIIYAFAGVTFIIIAIGGIVYMKKRKNDKSNK